jgi:hypothetical protein
VNAPMWVARMVGRLIPAAATVRGADRARWRQAARLEDLGELTAAWLGGHIASQPGYYGSVDVDEDDAPGLTAALIALNRVGFVTRSSQAGADDEVWRQNAAVEGYASEETVELLRRRLHGSGYEIIARPCRAHFAPFAPAGEGIPVTSYQGEPYTWFGRALNASEIAFDLDGAGRSAIKDAQRALQVTIWDPTAGPNTLWEALDRAAQETSSLRIADALARIESVIGATAVEVEQALQVLVHETRARYDRHQGEISAPSGDQPSLVSDAGLSADGAR